MKSILLSSLILVLWNIVSDRVEYENLAPFGALVKRCKQLINRLWVHVEYIGIGRRVSYFAKGSDGVCYHHRVRVRD